MFVSGRVFHNSLFHLCARHFTRNDLKHAYQQFFLVFLVLSPLYMVAEQDRRNLSLSPVNFFGKTGRVSYFCPNLCPMYVCITEIPVASWVFWHTYRPCPMIPSRRNANACILHACDVSFTIANYNVMGSSGTTDKCTKMLNSRWGSRRYMGL